MRVYRPTWKDKDGQRRRSGRWWLDFTTANGRRWRFPGLTDKRQTEVLARNVEKLLAVCESGDALSADLLKWLECVPAEFRARLAEAGLIDADRAGGLKLLVETDAKNKIIGGHLADMLSDLTARNVSADQCRLVGQRVRDVLRRAGCRLPRDLTAARVQAAIAALGEPAKDAPGLSKQSLLHYVRACKQFSRWLQREGRTAADALIGLKKYNPETDKRRERRGFTAEEVDALLAYTGGGPMRFGLTGPTRVAVYRLAFASGLRANEIRTLTAASFNLDADPPTVTVQAGYSKRRRQDVQPLPADAAEALASFLATADPERPFALPGRTAAMLRMDLHGARTMWIADAATEAERQERAEDPDFLVARDSAGLVLDFHSFRHGYVTAICKATRSPRVMMELARHSDPRLTMKRYSRVAVQDSARALAALPRLAGPDKQRETMRATGTDSATAAQDAAGLRRAGDRRSAGQAGPAGVPPCGRSRWRTRGRAHANGRKPLCQILCQKWGTFGGLDERL